MCQSEVPGRNYIHPPPPPPYFWLKGIFQGRGVGVYILRPHEAGILYAPPFYTPPTPRRVISGVGGWGCIKIGPVEVTEFCLQSSPSLPQNSVSSLFRNSALETVFRPFPNSPCECCPSTFSQVIKSGQSTGGGPKWTKMDLLRPKWTKMVVLTILGHFFQYTFRQYCGDSLSKARRSETNLSR